MSLDVQSNTNLLAVRNELLLPNVQDGNSSIQGTISGRSSSLGLGSCCESLIGADWLEEIDLALKELIIENEREGEAEKISINESIEIDANRITLTPEEEKEIQKKIKSQLMHEYKKIFYGAHEKSKVVKKNFRVFLEDARDALVKARVKDAQQKTKDEMRAIEEQHAKILQKRTKKRCKKLAQDKKGMQFAPTKEHDQERAMEQGHLRKIQSELDRVRARAQRQKKAAMRTKKETFKQKDALLHLKLERLERDHELHRLILEMYDFGLHEEARILTNALSVKEDTDREIEQQMRKAKLTAKRQALERLRKERIAEKERKERERIEQERLRKIREEEERRRKLFMLLKRRAHNLERHSWAMTSMLNLRMTNANTFSYF